MADVFVRRRHTQIRSRERRFGEIPLSTGEIEYLTRQDDASRRRQRLLQVREQEKRAAQLVTQRYRDNLRKLQSYKLHLAQRDHRHHTDTVLSALHEKYQSSLQGVGTAQRNARQKMIELMELARLEQDKWSMNRCGEKLRFKDAVETVHEDASMRLARRREMEKKLKRLKEMSVKHRSDASARTRRELEQELTLQQAQEDAQRYRRQHVEADEFSFPRKTAKDVTAYQFTRTHCVAVPLPGAATQPGSQWKTNEPSAAPSIREVKVIRHNRNTHRPMTSAIDQAKTYRKEVQLRQEHERRRREQQAELAGARGQDALGIVESIEEGTRALEWLVELEQQARVEKAMQLDAEVVKHEPRREALQQADDSGSDSFARLFGIEEGSDGLLDESAGGQAARLDGHPERIAARRAGSMSASDESWLLDDEWRTPSEQFDADAQDIAAPVERPPTERMIDQKIETMNELLKKIASYGEHAVEDDDDEADRLGDDAVNHHRSSRERYEEWRTAQEHASRAAFEREESQKSDLNSAAPGQKMDDAVDASGIVANRSTSSPPFDRHNARGSRPQDRIDSSAVGTRRSSRLASVGPSITDQARVASGSERLQSEAAAGRSSGGRAEELAASGRWSDSSHQDAWQPNIRDQGQQSQWNRMDEFPPSRSSQRDQQDHPDALNDEWKQSSRGSDADSGQASLDELEAQLQQVLEDRRSSQLGRTERRRRGNHRKGTTHERDIPPSTRGERDAQDAWVSTRRASTSNRRGIRSTSAAAGEFDRDLHEEHADFKGEQARDEAMSGSFRSQDKRESREEDGSAHGQVLGFLGGDECSAGAEKDASFTHAAAAAQPSRQHQRDRHGDEIAVGALHHEDEYSDVEYQASTGNSPIQAPSVEHSPRHQDAELSERAVDRERPSRDLRSPHDGSEAEHVSVSPSSTIHGEPSQLPDGIDKDHDERADQASRPSAVVALDESEDGSDFDSSLLFTEAIAQPGGIASYLRQMQQEGLAMQSSSSSMPQYSLPLSDSFSSMNDSVVEPDAGVAALTNQLLPLFPHQRQRLSEASASTADPSEQQEAPRGAAHEDAAILVTGLAMQDDQASAKAASTRQAQESPEEKAQQDIARLPSRRGVATAEPPRGPLHDLSFSSDSSSDMSAFIYLTKMRKVASMGTPTPRTGEATNSPQPLPAQSSSGSLSGLSSLSSTPARVSHRSTTQQRALARRDSVESSSSSTPSIDARFQYLVNMTAVAAQALPLHMNLPPRDRSGFDMRVPPPPVKLHSDSSDSEEDDGDSQAGARDNADQVATTEVERRERSDSMTDGQNADGRTQYPLPAAPFGQFDLSNPPRPAFRSASSSASSASSTTKASARSGSSKSERGSRRSDRSRRDDELEPQFALEKLSQRLAGLPPPPFGSLDMSHPPDPLAWECNDEKDNDNASSAVGSEATSSRPKDTEAVDQMRPDRPAQPRTSVSPRKKGEALFVPLEIGSSEIPTSGGSLADAFRQRHPHFHRQARETNQSLLDQRREQLAARRAESTASASSSRLQQPSIRVKPKAPISPTRRGTPSTLSMPPPALLDRLATGERAKISAQEMKDRTRRLYSQLPEVAERKRQEDVIERRRQRLAEIREREKLRRQQQQQQQRQR